MKDVLSEIIAHKKIEVENQKKLVSINQIEKKIEEQTYTSISLNEALLHLL